VGKRQTVAIGVVALAVTAAACGTKSTSAPTTSTVPAVSTSVQATTTTTSAPTPTTPTTTATPTTTVPATTVPTTAVPTTAASTPTVDASPGDAFSLQVKPAMLELSGDGTNIVYGLTWPGWDGHGATGNGTVNVLGCNPNCASGSSTPTYVRIYLNDPVNGIFSLLTENIQGQSSRNITLPTTPDGT
jgi:hypothetical protein